MEAIILCGGLGSRLRSVVKGVPKPMAQVNGRPFLVYILEDLRKQKVKKVILATGYLKEFIKKYFGNSYFDIEITYSEEEWQLGTGGAIREALKHCSADRVLICNGDTYLDSSVSEGFEVAESENCNVIYTKRLERNDRYGGLTILGNVVVDFKEKPEHASETVINGGKYIIKKDWFLESCPESGAFSLENDYLPLAIKKYKFKALNSEGLFIDIGIPEDYFRAQALF